MGMPHSFDVEYAQKFGLECAILLHNFQHWIGKNIANKTNFREGRTWTYNSVEAYRKQFPYLSTRQIRGAISKLLELNVLVKAHFGDKGFDRTTWYAFSDESLYLPHLSKRANEEDAICQNEQMHLSKRANHLSEPANGLYKTDVYTDKDIRTDVRESASESTDNSKLPPFSAVGFLADAGVEKNVIADYLKVRRAKRSAATKTALQKLLREIEKAGMSANDGVRICAENSWVGFNAEWLERLKCPHNAQNSRLEPANTDKQWFESAPEIEKMGQKHGVEQKSGEHFQSYRIRVLKASGDDKAMQHAISAARGNAEEQARLHEYFYNAKPIFNVSCSSREKAIQELQGVKSMINRVR